MRYVIQIPKPCGESWDAMTQADNGRHCAQCEKTVVDFSGWQQEDIVTYMQQHSGERVCGRFRNEQLNVPFDTVAFVVAVERSPLPLYRKIAAILLVSIGLLEFASIPAHAQQPYPHTTVAKDTSRPMMLGEIAPSVKKKPVSHKKAPVKKKIQKPAEPEHLKGDVILEPGSEPTHTTGGAIFVPLTTEVVDTSQKNRR